MWRKHGTRFGDFDVSVNGANLLKFYQQPSPQIAQLLAARSAGQINAGTNITGGGSYIRYNGKPDWKWTASATWRLDHLTVGAFTQYISDVNDTSLLDSAGTPWVVKSQATVNIYGQYEFSQGWAQRTYLKLGVKNLFDKDPALSSNGYMASVYQPYGRYYYASIRKTF